MLLDSVILLDFAGVVILYDSTGYVFSEDLAETSEEVLRCHSTILAVMIGVAEGWIQEELDESSELLLAETFCRAHNSD